MTQETKAVALEQETVNVLPVSRKVGKGLAKLVADVKAALKSGSTIVEAVAIGEAVLQDLVPQLAQVAAVESEAVADPADEFTTVFLTGRDVYAAVIG